MPWYEELDDDMEIDEEIYFIRDYLDREKIQELYRGRRLIDNRAVVTSEHARVCTIDRRVYEEFFRCNQFFGKQNFYVFILQNTYTLRS